MEASVARATWPVTTRLLFISSVLALRRNTIVTIIKADWNPRRALPVDKPWAPF
jgi:hypothetical protein